MQNNAIRTILTGTLLLALLCFAVTAFTALLLGYVPNDVDPVLVGNWSFYQMLWRDNALETLKIALVENPLLVVERRDAETGQQVWGLYFYTGTLLIYTLASGFTAMRWQRLQYGAPKYRLFYLLGLIALLLGATYVRRMECCGSGPGWVFDTWLLARAYTPGVGPVDWIELYQVMEPWMWALQGGALLMGVILWYRLNNASERSVASN